MTARSVRLIGTISLALAGVWLLTAAVPMRTGGGLSSLPSYAITNNDTRATITFDNALDLGGALTADSGNIQTLAVPDTLTVANGDVRMDGTDSRLANPAYVNSVTITNYHEYISAPAFNNGNVTNAFFNFAADVFEINATNNVHFLLATNEPSDGVRVGTCIISTFGGLNRVLSFATNVFSLTGTNYVALRSNTVTVVSVINRRGTNRLASYNVQVTP